MAEKHYYTVMTYSFKFPGERLARVWPGVERGNDFWTTTNPDKIWKMTREEADEVASRLRLNQPRVVRFDKALKIIEAQRDARLAAGAGPGDPDAAAVPDTVTLRAKSLAHRAGFSGVDLLGFLMEDMGPEYAGIRERVDALGSPEVGEVDSRGEPAHCGEHKVLVALVREHLAPLLPGVEIRDTFSSDNPVMAETEEGREFCRNSDIRVEIGVPEMMRVIERMEREAEVSSP